MILTHSTFATASVCLPLLPFRRRRAAGERMDRVIDARATSLDISSNSMRDQHPDKISLRRRVTMENVAAMALFLSSKAAIHIGSQAIIVDGNVEFA